jgi:hypothetical protein
VLLFAATLALLGPPAPAMSPQTTVELRVSAVDDGAVQLLEQALLRQLGDRLLADGHRLVPAGHAAGVRVWIHLEVDRVTIDARGAVQRGETVAGGDPVLVGLEVQQLTTALVEEVQPASAAPQPAVVLDLSGAAADPELRVRLQNGLLARGVALTRRPNADDRRLCVVVEPSGAAQVHVTGGAGACTGDPSPARIAGGETVERAREMLLDQAVGSLAAHAARVAPVAAPPPDEQEVAPRVRSGPRLVAAPIVPRPVSVGFAAHGGVLGRVGGGPDGLVGLAVRAGRRRGIGGGVELTLVPSRAERLRVLETLPTAVLDWRIGVRERGLVVLGLFAGPHLHSYVQAGSNGARATRVGVSAGATIRLGWLGRRGALLFAGLRTGWSGGRWTHIVDGGVSWRRSGMVLGLEVGAGWDVALRRRSRR